MQNIFRTIFTRQYTKREWRYFEISIVYEEMAQQSTGPTWTRLLTIALYLLFASLPALSFAIFYALLWVSRV